MNPKDSESFKKILLERRQKIMRVEGVLESSAANKSSQMKITTGSWVSIVDLETGELQELRVVSTVQPGVRFDEISSWSPLGKALLGRKVGESICVEAPKGTMRYQILKIAEDL